MVSYPRLCNLCLFVHSGKQLLLGWDWLKICRTIIRQNMSTLRLMGEWRWNLLFTLSLFFYRFSFTIQAYEVTFFSNFFESDPCRLLQYPAMQCPRWSLRDNYFLTRYCLVLHHRSRLTANGNLIDIIATILSTAMLRKALVWIREASSFIDVILGTRPRGILTSTAEEGDSYLQSLNALASHHKHKAALFMLGSWASNMSNSYTVWGDKNWTSSIPDCTKLTTD